MYVVRWERIRDGICPVHATALARRPRYGICDACSAGWSWSASSTNAGLPGVGLHKLPGRVPNVGDLPTTGVSLRFYSTSAG